MVSHRPFFQVKRFDFGLIHGSQEGSLATPLPLRLLELTHV